MRVTVRIRVRVRSRVRVRGTLRINFHDLYGDFLAYTVYYSYRIISSLIGYAMFELSLGLHRP